MSETKKFLFAIQMSLRFYSIYGSIICVKFEIDEWIAI